LASVIAGAKEDRVANSANSNRPYGSDQQSSPPLGPQRYATRALGDPAPADLPALYAPPLAPIAYADGRTGYGALPPGPIPSERPLGVVLILIHHALTIAMSAYGCALTFAMIHDWWIGVMLMLVLFGLGFMSLLIAVGVGLWRMKEWAMIVTIAGYAYYGYTNIQTLFTMGNPFWMVLLSGLLSLASIATVIYLLRPATRAMFRR
jgi:hypothetical protein